MPPAPLPPFLWSTAFFAAPLTDSLEFLKKNLELFLLGYSLKGTLEGAAETTASGLGLTVAPEGRIKPAIFATRTAKLPGALP